MDTEYRLRPATHTDLPPLFAIHVAAFRDCVEPTWGWDEEAQRRIFSERFDPTVAQVIEGPDGEILGDLVVETRDDSVFLTRIALHPHWQGRGIGTHIVRAVVASARGNPCIPKGTPAKKAKLLTYP